MATILGKAQFQVSRASTEFASLDAAIAALGASSAVLTLVPGDTKTLTGDLTIPANVTLDGRMGVIETNGHTLTVNGPVTAGNVPLFDVSGGGSVIFGGGDRVNVRWFGAVGDGAANDTIAVRSVLDAASASGLVAYFPKGTYLLTGWTLYEPTAPVLMYGDEGATIKSPSRSAHFIDAAAHLIRVEGLAFQTFNIVFAVNAAADVAGVVLDRCSFEDVNSAVGARVAGDFTVGQVVVRNCTAFNVNRFLSLNGAGHDFVYVAGCDVEQVTDGLCIIVGTNSRDRNERVTVTGSRFRNIGKDTQNADAHAVIVYGHRVLVTNNHIENVWNASGSTTGAEGIYSKAKRIIVSGNTLINAGGGDGVATDGCGEASINLKGSEDDGATSPLGSNVIVANNHIYFSDEFDKNAVHGDGVAGIQVRCSQALVTGNVIENAPCGIRTLGERNVLIQGNIVTDVKRTPGIRYQGHAGSENLANVIVSDNVVDGFGESGQTGYGIVFATGTGSDLVNGRVAGNIVSNPNAGVTSRGILVNPSSSGSLDGMSVEGNVVRGTGIGVQLSSPAVITNLALKDNLFVGVTTAVTNYSLVGSIASFHDNVGFATAANGTATVANGNTSVTINHGLGVTPALKDFAVTPTNDLGNATKYWISAPTSTQFTINVDADPGPDTATFAWTVRVRP